MWVNEKEGVEMPGTDKGPMRAQNGPPPDAPVIWFELHCVPAVAVAKPVRWWKPDRERACCPLGADYLEMIWYTATPLPLNQSSVVTAQDVPGNSGWG